MNTDRLSSQHLYNQIKTLSNKLEKQKQATQTAEKEAKETRINNQTTFLRTFTEALSESVK